jgi:hypothetical protein
MSQSAIAKVWRGEERLFVVFWWYYVVASFVLGPGLAVAVPLLLPFVPRAIGIWSAYAIGAAYFVWISVGLWRCAFNVESRAWGYVVRIVVILDILGAIDFVVQVSQGVWPEP